MKNIYIIGVVILLMTFFSCKKFLDTDLNQSQITAEEVFADDLSATGAVTGIYKNMLSSRMFGGGVNGLTGLTGLSSDELNNFKMDEQYRRYENNELKAETDNLSNLWQDGYKAIYQANDVIAELESSKTITASVKQQLTGEAHFIRALSYFYLTQLFGDVPLVLSTDYRQNLTKVRTPVEQIYEQIIKDVIIAQTLLPATYVNAERIRPNKATATALLARMYLYLKDWNNAELQATKVIDEPTYALQISLDKVFLKGSSEVIWQLASEPPFNTLDGYSLVITSSYFSHRLKQEFVESFETNDKRTINWIGSYSDGTLTHYFPFKYKAYQYNAPITEHFVVFRAAEQYLIRAEARAMKNNLDGAREDLNAIRSRAGLIDVQLDNQDAVLNAILKERQHELFCEWAHRWFDVKRLGKANEIFGNLKPLSWQSTDVLYPLPVNELRNNTKLTQNPGY